MWNETIKTKLLVTLEKAASEASDQGKINLALNFSKARDIVKGVGTDSLPVDFVSTLETLVNEEFLRSNLDELYIDAAKSGDGLIHLRHYLQARPQIASELSAWESQLRNLAYSVRQEQGSSTEADASDKLSGIARKLKKHYETIKENQAKFQEAVTGQQLGEINRIITSVTSVQRQLEDDKVNFDEFPNIYSELLESAKNFLDEAGEAKGKVSGELTIYLTLQTLEFYDKALDGLNSNKKAGILEVPKSLDSDHLIPIDEAIHNTRINLVNYLKTKIGERIASANVYLGKESNAGLSDAETELEKIKILLDNRHVSGDLKGEDIVLKELRTLKEKVNGLLKVRAEAEAFVDKASTLDEVDALNQLIGLQYKWLDDIAIQKRALQDKFLTKNKPLVKNQITQSQSLCRERKLDEYTNYFGALKALEEEKSRFAKISPDAVNTSGLQKQLEDQIAIVRNERDAWKKFSAFQKKFDELSRSNRVEPDLLDGLSVDERTYWKGHFKSEYGAIEAEVVKQGGIKITFDKAWKCYMQDPADRQIEEFLVNKDGQKTITSARATALQCRQADALLNIHYAFIALQDAKRSLQDTVVLIAHHHDWYTNVQNRVQTSKNFCQLVTELAVENLSPEENKFRQAAEQLSRDLEQLLSKTENVYDIWDRCDTLLQQHMYKEACLDVMQSKGESDPATEFRNIYTIMLAHIKNLWRDERMNEIQSVIVAGPHHLERLRQVAQEIARMEEFKVLNHDGDGLLISRVYSIWHLCEIEDALGFTLEEIQDDNLNKLGSIRGLDWGRLLQDIRGLLKYPPEGNILPLVERLRLVALGYYGLSLDRKQSISLLDEEIKHLSGSGESAIIYITLALRYLEEPSGYDQAEKLAANLEGIGTRTSQIAFGLKKIIAAHNYRKNEEFINAIDSLNSGMSTLKTYIPELSGALESTIKQTSYGWCQAIGDGILNKLQRETRLFQNQRNQKCPEAKFFDIWRNLNQAHFYLPDDDRVQSIAQLLSRFSEDIGKKLYGDADRLLDNYEEPLKHKIELGTTVLGYLEIAFPDQEAEASYKPDSQVWQELEELQTELKNAYAQWQDAWDDLIKSRRALKTLLLLSARKNGGDLDSFEESSVSKPEEWVWNKDVNKKPLQVINATQTIINKALEEKISGYTPPEFNYFNQFLIQLKQAATTILTSFQAFVQAVKDEKYEDAKKQLMEKLRVDRYGFEAKLNGLLSNAFDEQSLTVSLDPFYRLENPMLGDYVVGLDSIKNYLDGLLKDCNTWSEFSKTMSAKVKELSDRRNEARRYLTGSNGKLSDAVNLCRDDIPVMLALKENRNDIPRLLLELKRSVEDVLPNMQIPLSMRALREAKPDEDSPAPISKPVRATWEALTAASRDDLKELWKSYICFEIASGLIDLGPVMDSPVNDIDNLRKISPAWNEVWSEILRDPMASLEKPKPKSLENLISERLKGLEETIRQITQHLSRFSGNGVTVRSQAILQTLIEKADSIDSTAPSVKTAHQKYTEGQNLVTTRR